MNSKFQKVEVLKRLKRLWKNPGAMEIGNPYQNLVAIMLSARTRDEQVLKLLPNFFKTFPTPVVLSKSTQGRIEDKINTIGMYRQKARNLKLMAGEVVSRFGGKMPDNMVDLLTLPGVGRKTASVLLVTSFGKPAIAVDTHVHRVTNRLGWVCTKTPEETESALLKFIPKQWHKTVNRVFVKHGRYICIGKPRCWACPLCNLCGFKNKNLATPKNAEDILADIKHREMNLESLRKNAI